MPSQPTNAGDQNAAVGSIVHLLQRIKPLANEYEINRQKQKDFKIGFNLFELISDHYFRETFHSDILNAFLDPAAKHGEKKYLALFLEFLRSQHEAKNINPSDYLDAQVVKEEGRIDILIKGTRHSVIIENKINGADDQYRQLPDYLKKVESDYHTTCDAIIYLRLNSDARPDMTGWNEDEKKQVNARLNVILAYDGTDDGETDLLKGWILRCEAKSNNNPNAQHILRQYGEIIKKLGINAMNKPLMDDLYKTLVEGDNLETALSLKAMLDDFEEYRALKIFDEFKDSREPFHILNNTKSYHGVYFEGTNWKVAPRLGLDIGVGPKSYLFQFWDKDDRPGKNRFAETILRKMGWLDKYAPSTIKDEGGLFCKEFLFPSPSMEDDLVVHIREFKKKLNEVISSD